MANRMPLIALALAAVPLASNAHPRGLYDTQQQAEQRAKSWRKNRLSSRAFPF